MKHLITNIVFILKETVIKLSDYEYRFILEETIIKLSDFSNFAIERKEIKFKLFYSKPKIKPKSRLGGAF